MENKVCKKCHKILPEGYKYRTCEACRNKQMQKAKNIGKTVLTAVGGIAGVAGVALTVATKVISIKSENNG